MLALKKTECVGSFPLPVPQTVGLRIAQIAETDNRRKPTHEIYHIIPHTWEAIYTRLFTKRMYTATHGRVYNIPTVDIYVATLSSAML